MILLVACGGGLWWVSNNWVALVASPAGNAVKQVVNESDLRQEDKQAIVQQVDRIVEEAKAGKIDGEKLQQIMKNLAESPVLPVGVVLFVEDKYVNPSGLSDEEKSQARRTLERVARGVFEEKIPQGALQPAIEPISERDAKGDLKLKEHVSDDELREALANLKKLADDAAIPDEPFEINIGAEVKKAVDKALASDGQGT
ncbi:MAG: hypothetical protein RIC55_21335 [Pirellulaceae bacterium]